MDIGFLIFVIVSLLFIVIVYQISAIYIFNRLKRIEKHLTKQYKPNNSDETYNINDGKADC